MVTNVGTPNVKRLIERRRGTVDGEVGSGTDLLHAGSFNPFVGS